MQIDNGEARDEDKRFDVKECRRRIILVCGMHRSGTSALAYSPRTPHKETYRVPRIET
jgi:hypothetical protein